MSKTLSKSTIEWTERVWNFLTGCTKISSGCKFCYMFVLAARLKAMGNPMYRNGADLTVHEEKLILPYSFKKPTVFFVNSMSDMFHEDVPLQILISAFEIMNETPHHTYQVLTKRPERLLELQHHFKFTPNIWIGVSVEDERVLHRVDTLRKINAQVKWISAEPLIGPLTDLDLDGISWLVCGGESGNNKNLRPIKEEWVIEIMEKCRKKEIPFFFKQWGKARFNPNQNDPTISKDHPQHAKGGCQLQKKVYREFPESFNQIQNTTTMKTQNEKPQNNSVLNNLTPFKRLIGEALLNGEKPDALAVRLSKECEMPVKTAKAYITMVLKHIENPKPTDANKAAIETPKKLVPFRQLILEALNAGEDPMALAAKLAKERNIPISTAKSYTEFILKYNNEEETALSEEKKEAPKLEHLTDFKKRIAEDLLKGDNIEDVIARVSEQRKMPLATAKAYVTMVVKRLASELKGFEEFPDEQPEPGLHFTPFKRMIFEALGKEESDEVLAKRISVERSMPLRTAKAYITMVRNDAYKYLLS